MIFKEKTIGVISLGCDKNRVDTEKMLAFLGSDKITSDISQAQIIIINSCAFLESSRKEAIETVFECNAYRESGRLEKLVLTGCLPQKFISEMFNELTEVDIFLGINDYASLPEAIEKAYSGERVNFVNVNEEFKTTERVITTPLHYAYLKISDGCNNHCTYCLIPKIRGRYKSTPIEELVAEAEKLEVSELILVAQDVTVYGSDIYGKPTLVELIKRLTALENIGSVRLLYAYPDKITDELIAEIKNNGKVIKYLDIPFQHADDDVLKVMNRKGTKSAYLKLIEKLRTEIPEIALRSTFIAGFPGETEEQFENLIDFIKTAKLHNAGFFAYSREEDTPSYKLPCQIEDKVKQKRVKRLYKEQTEIAKEIYGKYKGKTLRVLADGIDYDKQAFVGRAYFSAPDIDGRVYFYSNGEVNQGEYYDVKIDKIDGYDLYGGVEK